MSLDVSSHHREEEYKLVTLLHTAEAKQDKRKHFYFKDRILVVILHNNTTPSNSLTAVLYARVKR